MTATLACLLTCAPWNIDQMPLEEKVGQVMMSHFCGNSTNEDATELVQSLGIGGIIYYAWSNELSSKRQIEKLSCGLQALVLRDPQDGALFEKQSVTIQTFSPMRPSLDAVFSYLKGE